MVFLLAALKVVEKDSADNRDTATPKEFGWQSNNSFVAALKTDNAGYDTFYPRDAMLARAIEIATCLSVRPSVRHAPVLCQNEES